MGLSRTPTQNTAGDGFPADPIDGSLRELAKTPVTFRDRSRQSPASTDGAHDCGLTTWAWPRSRSMAAALDPVCGRRVRPGASISSSLAPGFNCSMALRVAACQAESRYRVQAPDEVDLSYVKVCCKTGGGQVRAHCRQLLFRALSGSAVECDDWAHLDGRGDLNSGTAR